MASQSGNNVQIAYKVQAALGTAESGSGATGLHVVPQQGLKLTKAVIDSNAIRTDGQTTRGRHGTAKADAAYQLEIGVGMADDLIEAVMRGTWTASADFTSSDVTSTTTTTSTIVATSGSWLTLGVRRGDMVKITGATTSANNGFWMRVLGVTATTITVPTASLTLDASADTGTTITVAKTIVSGSAPTERYFTFEEFGQDIAHGLVGSDLKVSKVELNIQPDANILATFTLMGLNVTAQNTSANFSSPTYSTALPLVMSDGIVSVNDVDYSVLTGFTLTWDLGGVVTPVLAASSVDVFLSNGKLSGSFSALRSDLTFFNAFSAETQVDFFLVMSESGGDTADFISLYIGNAVLDGADAPVTKDGPLVETVPWRAGIDEGGSDRAATTMKWATSAA